MSEFRLEKWYMDAASDSGQAFIAYSATLHWGLINLNYSGFTFLPKPSGKILQRNTFTRQQLPQVTKDKIEWKCLSAKGIWTKKEDSISEILFRSPEGEIEWSCLFPKCESKIEFKGTIENSFGYAEKITLTIPPWKIPIQQLHWGRYLSQEHTIIWIQWIGPVPKTLLFFNGRRITDAEITTTHLTFLNYVLELTQPQTMRKGTVLSTVFAKFPSIAKLFPRSIINMQENKWVSEGVLIENGRTLSRGKAIHEWVLWK